MLKWQNVICRTDMLLDGSVVSLNFGDMLIAGHNVDGHSKGSKVPMHGFELVVGNNDGDLKNTYSIYTNNNMKVTDDGLVVEGTELSS